MDRHAILAIQKRTGVWHLLVLNLLYQKMGKAAWRKMSGA